MNSSVIELINRIKKCGGILGSSAPQAQIDEIEIELGINLPKDYKEFLLFAGGKSSKERWRGLWGADEIVQLNRNLPTFQWFGGLVGIGNEGFIVYALDYRDGIPKIVSVGLSSSDWDEVVNEADTFEEWLEKSLQ